MFRTVKQQARPQGRLQQTARQKSMCVYKGEGFEFNHFFGSLFQVNKKTKLNSLKNPIGKTNIPGGRWAEGFLDFSFFTPILSPALI